MSLAFLLSLKTKRWSRGRHLQARAELVGKHSRARAPIVFAEERCERPAAPREGPWYPRIAKGSGEGWAKREWEGTAAH